MVVADFAITSQHRMRSIDGSRRLYEMMGCGDAGKEPLNETKEYLPDYQINLLWARNVEEIELFQSSLQYFFGMLKYNRDKVFRAVIYRGMG